MKQYLFLSIFFASFVSQSVFAYDDEDSNSREKGRLWFFGGLDGGYFRMNTDIKTTDANGVPDEFDKNGFQLNAKGLLSYYWYYLELDAGLGYLYNRGSSEENVLLTAGTGAGQTTKVSETITTKSLFGELAARFRFSDAWSAGPIYSVAFGTDANFGAKISKKNVTNFVGGQVMYEFPIFDTWRMRLHATGLTDLTIENRQTFLAMLGVQLGLPIFPWGSQEEKQEEVVAAPPPPPPAEEPPPPPPPVEPEPIAVPAEPEEPGTVRVQLENQLIYFDFDSNKLSKGSQKMMKELGAFLAANAAIWGSVNVEGHTDARGSAKYNQKLSEGRALSVKKALIAGGASKAKVTSEGLGSTKPRVEGDTEQAYAKNRRVELVFKDVKDADALQEKMRELKKSALEENN